MDKWFKQSLLGFSVGRFWFVRRDEGLRVFFPAKRRLKAYCLNLPDNGGSDYLAGKWGVGLYSIILER